MNNNTFNNNKSDLRIAPSSFSLIASPVPIFNLQDSIDGSTLNNNNNNNNNNLNQNSSSQNSFNLHQDSLSSSAFSSPSPSFVSDSSDSLPSFIPHFIQLPHVTSPSRRRFSDSFSSPPFDAPIHTFSFASLNVRASTISPSKTLFSMTYFLAIFRSLDYLKLN